MASCTPKLAIVGAGFTGMWAALRAARRWNRLIILIAPEPTLYIRPRLYENDVSTASAPLADLLAMQFRPGAVHNFAEYSFDVDQMDSALKLDAHLESLAALPDLPARNTVVVCRGRKSRPKCPAECGGSSPTASTLRWSWSSAVPASIPWGPRLTQSSPKLWSPSAFKFWQARAWPGGVTTESGTRIASSTVIWTVGMRASALTAQIPAERDELGRLFVTQNLKVVGLDRVYATGNTAHVATDDEKHLAAMSCQHAIVLGNCAGQNAMSDVLGLPQTPYSQLTYVTCLALGPWGALFTLGWGREVSLVKEEGYKMKTHINTQIIRHRPTELRLSRQRTRRGPRRHNRVIDASAYN
ncbi:hypothetical protein DFH09DRAFT_1483002 [Mycena vulgaris]|nr:hypothetical protein DFH09DRAFT_1483002 [Mycena vulgaris]